MVDPLRLIHPTFAFRFMERSALKLHFIWTRVKTLSPTLAHLNCSTILQKLLVTRPELRTRFLLIQRRASLQVEPYPPLELGQVEPNGAGNPFVVIGAMIAVRK
jgi:hypothetical protein